MSVISFPAFPLPSHFICVNSEKIPHVSNATFIVQNPQLNSNSGIVKAVFIREQNIKAVAAYPAIIRIMEFITDGTPNRFM